MNLSAEHLRFAYAGGPMLLDDFSLCIEGGQRIGLAAPSGFGKTTLCKLLSGYLKPQAGRVMLGGLPLSNFSGYCPVQMIWQHPELAVNPRMKMSAVLEEVPDTEPRIYAALGIQRHWLNRFPGELSGGELQRFCIARAFGPDTRFILADEITSMLDLITRNELLDFILAECAHRAIGLLFVSHKASVLAQTCEQVLDLSEHAAVRTQGS